MQILSLSWIFSHTTFWLQIHNVPKSLLTQATGELVGKTLGMAVQVADLEDDGVGGKFLRVRTVLDISRPLPRCCKLWSKGKLVGQTRIKYERLPNLCYWCGCVNHSEKECEIWLQGKGQLSREELQYGDWMRANSVKIARKTVAVIPGASHNQAPWHKQ